MEAQKKYPTFHTNPVYKKLLRQLAKYEHGVSTRYISNEVEMPMNKTFGYLYRMWHKGLVIRKDGYWKPVEL